MKKGRKQFFRNAKSAFRGIGGVLGQPRYLLLAFGIAFLISCLIYFSINFAFYGSLLGSGLPFSEKLSVMGMMTKEMAISYFKDLGGVLLLVLSLMQGVALTLLIYNFRENRQLDNQMMAKSGIAAFAAVIGLGCVPCGTSLLIPLMTLVFSSSAPLLLDAANQIVLAIAIVLTIYSLYQVGKIAETNRLMIAAKEGGGK